MCALRTAIARMLKVAGVYITMGWRLHRMINIDLIRAMVVAYVQGLNENFDPANVKVTDTAPYAIDKRMKCSIDLEQAGLACTQHPAAKELFFHDEWKWPGDTYRDIYPHDDPGVWVDGGHAQRFTTSVELNRILPTLGLVYAPGAQADRQKAIDRQAFYVARMQRLCAAAVDTAADALVRTVMENLRDACRNESVTVAQLALTQDALASEIMIAIRTCRTLRTSISTAVAQEQQPMRACMQAVDRVVAALE